MSVMPTNREIVLRMLPLVRRDRIILLCVDTDIAVEAVSWEEAQLKMRDALVSYFRTFSEAEIERGDYARPSPLRYRIRWHVRWFAVRTLHLVERLKSLRANYDPIRNLVRFA